MREKFLGNLRNEFVGDVERAEREISLVESLLVEPHEATEEEMNIALAYRVGSERSARAASPNPSINSSACPSESIFYLLVSCRCHRVFCRAGVHD